MDAPDPGSRSRNRAYGGWPNGRGGAVSLPRVPAISRGSPVLGLVQEWIVRQLAAVGRRVLSPLALALACALGTSVSAQTQPAVASSDVRRVGGSALNDQPTPTSLLKDFIHFVRIDRADVAAGVARQLFDLKLTNVDFVKLVEESGEQQRFMDTIVRAGRIPALEESSAKMMAMYETGKLERARDPEQIKKNIDLLTGLVRPRLFARERLKAASEYAMPQLLTAFLDRSNPARQEQVRSVIVEMGPSAVIPLATALPQLDPVQQEAVVNVLAEIPYKTSLPFLADLRDTTQSSEVRSACDRAIAKHGGTGGADAATLFYALANQYYSQLSQLTSFPGEENQILWSFNPGIGLVMTAIRTPVYHEAMAMQYSERSMRLRSANPPALALWVAANYKRELNTPAGYVNPAYGPDRREAMYYGVASGSDILQMVLGRALDDGDTPLTRKSIAGLEKCAGGSSLWATNGGLRRPLPEALTYPNRRVQYESALALALAAPREAFTGSERVVPTLAGAIRDASSKVAVVIAADNETYSVVRSIIEKGKYSVLPFGRSVADLAGPISESPAIDLVVIANQREDAIPDLIQSVRSTTKIGATPVLVLTSADAYTSLHRRYERDVSIAIRQAAMAESQVLRSVDDLVLAASGGPVSEEEAKQYAARSLTALRDLAVSGNRVFDVSDAALPLIAALGDPKSAMKMDVAEVLSRIGQERTQTSLMDAALAATGPERVAMLGKVAESARRFGNLLPRRQVDRLLALASSGEGAEATAAAALMGSLNLPNSELVPLILGDKNPGGKKK